jgi:multiple sugar transport system substrate-binding protein
MFVLLVGLALSACALDNAPAGTAASEVALPTSSAATSAAPPQATSAESEPVTVTFSLFENERAAFEPLIGSFEAANPDVHLQLVMLDPFFARGEPPDYERVVLSAADTTSFPMSPQAIANGWVRDLTPLMEADRAFDRADFFPGTLEAASQGQRLYLMPRSLRVPVLFYNQDLWAAHGLPAPTVDWTWEDLLGAAEQLADRRGASTVYGMLDWFGTGALAGTLATAGVYRERSDRRPLDDPQVVAAVDRVLGLMKSGAVLSLYEPSFPHDGNHPDEVRAAEFIRNGQIGIWSPDLCCYNLQGKPLSLAVGIMPFPRPPFSNFTSVDSYAMSSGTAHPQEAWRWLAFLSRQAFVPTADFYNEDTTIPARPSVAEQSGYWLKQKPEYATALKAIVDGPYARDLIGARPLPIFFEVGFDTVFQAMLQEGKTAQVALRDAQRMREQQALEPSPTPNPEPIAVATPLPEATTGSTRIAFGTTGNNGEALRQLAAAFNQQNNGVFVEIAERDVSRIPPPPATLAERLDCFTAFGAPTSAEITATLDLRPLADADPSFDLNDYYPAFLAPFEHNSGLYGLPHEVYLRTLMYNQSIFEATGLARPSAEWTLDDLLATARSLTQGARAARQYGFAAPFSSWREVLFVLDRRGAAATTGGVAGLAPNYTNPQLRQAVQIYLDLLREASPHARLTDYARDEPEHNHASELIDAGRVAMWFSFGVDERQANGWILAAAPPPGLRSVGPNDFVASGLYISAKTQHRDACWAWLKFLSRDASTLAGVFPARRSLAESLGVTASLPAGTAETYRAYRPALERAPTGEPAMADSSTIDYYWLARAMDRALQGQDLERELDEAQRLTTQFLACVREGASGAVCAKQVDPNYQGWKNADLSDR